MNSWLVWAAFLLIALVLGLVGYRFSLRALRFVAVFIAMTLAVYITWYGLARPAKAAGGLSGAFARGADALSTALFRALPGHAGWIVIAALLVIGYRELEVWALHIQARSLDTSALADDQQDDASGEGKAAVSDKQRHDRLASELKFRLPAVEVRSPAILPGGSRAGGLASIAEASGVTGSGLAGAIINFFGTLWPGPRRLRVRVWVEREPDHPGIDDITRVTVDLDDPRTGASIATKTLAASCLDDAASVVAGYVARHIFAEDRTAPPWCTGAADGHDLAAMLLARQVRVYPEFEHEVRAARRQQIEILESVAGGNLCAGVARYELAQLYDLTGRHVDALLLHAINRERYPRFYRGRYRLAMSLEMLANPEPGRKIDAAERPRLDEALKILHRCGLTAACQSEVTSAGPGPVEHGAVEHGAVDLTAKLRADLLDAAWDELQAIRRYLLLPSILWRSFRYRDERGILRPYWRQRHRQAFHDGVCAALLLVAVRRVPIGLALSRRATRRLRHARRVMRIATAITGDSRAFGTVLEVRPVKTLERAAPMTRSLRTRHWFRRYSSRSWQAAYNLACAYAAIAQAGPAQANTAQANTAQANAGDGLEGLAGQVVTCLEFAVSNPECEMERPWEWIAHDPDFGGLRSPHDDSSAKFRMFLAAQKRRDYPSVPRSRPGPAAGPDQGHLGGPVPPQSQGQVSHRAPGGRPG